MTKFNACPKCNGKKVEIFSEPRRLDPDQSMFQAECMKKTCKWQGSWSMTAAGAVNSWNNFNDGTLKKKTKK